MENSGILAYETSNTTNQEFFSYIQLYIISIMNFTSLWPLYTGLY
jgi:hypothetical protein